MDGVSPGPALVGNYVLFLAVRQLLIYLAWVLAAALAGAAACWCCGYGAQAAWKRAELERQVWRAVRGKAPTVKPPPPDPITVEADRGIDEIEKYLADRAVVLPHPERVDEDGPGDRPISGT
jgi:hypothetical protein